ncbi:hypothetical protein P3T37_005040 [Kitasatospora sp. MAA4]|uniref:hypothetical protein n=1 Tax=Kitasatospora sp. MAA4 TaxID=3035093 RepID=UPI0024760B46|nr:hypothetical protein [Kitasatospora sp. MAA4]MDH6135624.1 hypothetical protein [Kitasatospora sp. MAA4]
MPFDDNFSQALREAAELAPEIPMDTLVDGAQSRSRRRTVRRRTAVAASAAGVLLAGLAVTQLQPSGSSLATSDGRSSQITGAFMDRTFKSLLPPGRVTEDQGAGIGQVDPPGAGPRATLKFDDGHGAGMINLSTNRVPAPVARGAQDTECPDPFTSPDANCVRTVRPDGSILLVNKLALRPGGPLTWNVTWTGTDGRQIRIDEYNSVTAAPPTTRPEPPLSIEQVTAIETSSAWDPVFEQFAAPASGAPSPGTHVAPPAEVIATAAALLPTGAQHSTSTDGQTSPDTAHFTVTLGGHTSVLQVTVYPNWDQGGNVAPHTVFEDSANGGPLTRTPNGTEVLARTSGAGSTLHLMVDTLHPDGTRVTVTEWNDPKGHQPAGDPLALTLDQLTTLATGSTWQQ